MSGPGFRQAGSPFSDSSFSSSVTSSGQRSLFDRGWDSWFIRLALVGGCVGICFVLRPFSFQGLPAVGLGFFIAMVILLAELRLGRAEMRGLVGGAVGAILGLVASVLITLVVSRTSGPEPTKSFVEFASLLSFVYLGLVIGSRR